MKAGMMYPPWVKSICCISCSISLRTAGSGGRVRLPVQLAVAGAGLQCVSLNGEAGSSDSATWLR